GADVSDCHQPDLRSSASSSGRHGVVRRRCVSNFGASRRASCAGPRHHGCKAGQLRTAGAGTLRAHVNGTMGQFAFALLDLRRIFHVALAITAIAMVHLYGPPSTRAQLDRYLVTPVLNASESVGRQVGSGAVTLRNATKFLGWE